MQLFEVIPESDEQFFAWFGVLQRSETLRDDRPGEGWHPAEWRAKALEVDAPSSYRLFCFGHDALTPVAVGALEVTRDDNLDWFRADLHVDPTSRRRGVGTAALRALEQESLRRGRRRLTFYVIEGASEGGRGPNRYFAPAVGYSCVEELDRRDIVWPRPAGELDRLRDACQGSAMKYEIISWRATTPNEFLTARARLLAMMARETPHHDAQWGAQIWNEARVRHHEETVDQMGRDLLVAVARDSASGELVGFSELTVSRDQPTTAYQWETLVIAGHRGHRLGTLLKVATMKMLEVGGYRTERVSTFNNRDNEPMIRVNENLGATVAGAMVGWSRDFG